MKVLIRRTLRHLLRHRGLLTLWLWRLTSILNREYVALLSQHVSRTPKSKITPSPASSRETIHRILFVCANMWEDRELRPELEKLAEVTFVDILPCIEQKEQQSFSPRAFDALWRQKVSGQYDVAIVYLDASRLNTVILDSVRRVVVGPVLGLNLDDKTTYAEYSVFRDSAQNYKRWAGRFDFNLTNSRAHVELYRDDGYPCIYLPTGFHYNPEVHYLTSADAFKYPISFVGSCKPERATFIEQLKSAGIAVNVFGGGWPDALFSNDGPQIFRSSQLNLGIGYNLPGNQFTNLKNRDFECPGAGGCYLTTYDWELANLLEVGKEMLCYRSLTDFMEIYLYYSRHPEECLKIGKAGFERCRREHTWSHRFQKVFAELGLHAKNHVGIRQ